MLDGGGWLWSLRLCLLSLVCLAMGGLFPGTWAVASAALPDGRAWEMVSPLDKNGGNILGIDGDTGGGVVQASADGEKMTYVSPASFGEGPRGAAIASQYVSARTSKAGWLVQNISTPMNDQTYELGGLGTPYRAFASDLSNGLVFGGTPGGGGGRPVEGPPLTPGAPSGYENYYLDAIPSGALQSLLAEAPNEPPEEFRLEFLGATPDLGHVVVQSSAALGPSPAEEPGTSNLYEWEGAVGRFEPVNVLPGGALESTHAVLFGGSGGAQGQAISEDGSNVIWTAETGTSDLYVRKGIGTGQPETVQADAPAGGGHFLTASSDGKKVFFADNAKLTGDSTASGGGFGDLYRFEPDAAEGSRLVDLTVDHVDTGGAEVLGVLGASADGSYLYFVANGRLAPNVPRAGNCFRGSSPGATCNLYLWHEGEGTRFIAALSGNDQSGSSFNALGVAFDWDPSVGVRTARVSRDGTRAVFMSERSLTGYDNTVSTGGSCGKNFNEVPLPAQCQEVFLYDASTSRLSCASCDPSGAQPTGPSGIPGGTEFKDLKALYQSRVLSESGGVDGRVFFESADGLVPQDTNGREDVYEYENGHIYLLSDGRNARGASFVDASISGNDAFFITKAQLVDQDTDQLVDLYDARAPRVPGEEVGFPVTPVLVCEGEGCRPAVPAAPTFVMPSSVTFAGLGNGPHVASKPVVKTKAKKVKAKKRKRKAKHGKKARVGKSRRVARRKG